MRLLRQYCINLKRAVICGAFCKMVSINSKLPNAGTTIFTVMSALSAKHNAVNLGQGFPDFPMDAELINLVNEAMVSGANQYVHMNGLPDLRQRIAEKCEKLYGNRLSAEANITVTPGATYAIYTALTAILQPGDEVIYFEPAYDSYLPNILVNRGVPVPIKLEHPEYSINWNRVKEKLNDKTRAIIINTPHNPTGSVMSDDDMRTLQELLKNTNVIVISDEVYEHLVFDNLTHHSILSYPELFERAIATYSFGKVYHCTGWKMGYAIAPDNIMKEFRKIHQFNCFTCNSPVQYGLAHYITREEKYLNLGKQIEARRDYFLSLMKPLPLKPLPSHGSYFQLYSYNRLSDEVESVYAQTLVKEAGVTTIPVSAFYHDATDNKVLRFCFAKKEATLEDAVERLSGFYHGK